jgi:hypothetical protein
MVSSLKPLLQLLGAEIDSHFDSEVPLQVHSVHDTLDVGRIEYVWETVMESRSS